jgi:hypothetical protein
VCIQHSSRRTAPNAISQGARPNVLGCWSKNVVEKQSKNSRKTVEKQSAISRQSVDNQSKNLLRDLLRDPIEIDASGRRLPMDMRLQSGADAGARGTHDQTEIAFQ